MNVNWFENLFDARRKIAAWQKEYNAERPHSSLGYLTPEEFARKVKEEGRGKEVDCIHLENVCDVCHFLTDPATATKLNEVV